MVGFLKNFSNKVGVGPEHDEIDEYLDTLGLENEDLFQGEADMWVKPYILQTAKDVEAIQRDLMDGNIVLINIEPLYKRNATRLKQAISQVKGTVATWHGDTARISEFKILATPRGVKVAQVRK